MGFLSRLKKYPKQTVQQVKQTPKDATIAFDFGAYYSSASAILDRKESYQLQMGEASTTNQGNGSIPSKLYVHLNPDNHQDFSIDLNPIGAVLVIKDLKRRFIESTKSIVKIDYDNNEYHIHAQYLITQLMEIFIRLVCLQLEKQCNCRIKDAIISAPVDFNQPMREAWIDCFKNCKLEHDDRTITDGLHVLYTLSEPVAAVYGCLDEYLANGVYIVIDSGHATTDIAEVKVGSENIVVVGQEGARQFGGYDLTTEIAAYLKRKYHDIFVDNHFNDDDITSIAEQLKIALNDFNNKDLNADELLKTKATLTSNTVLSQQIGIKKVAPNHYEIRALLGTKIHLESNKNDYKLLIQGQNGNELVVNNQSVTLLFQNATETLQCTCDLVAAVAYDRTLNNDWFKAYAPLNEYHYELTYLEYLQQIRPSLQVYHDLIEDYKTNHSSLQQNQNITGYILTGGNNSVLELRRQLGSLVLNNIHPLTVVLNGLINYYRESLSHHSTRQLSFLTPLALNVQINELDEKYQLVNSHITTIVNSNESLPVIKPFYLNIPHHDFQLVFYLGLSDETYQVARSFYQFKQGNLFNKYQVIKLSTYPSSITTYQHINHDLILPTNEFSLKNNPTEQTPQLLRFEKGLFPANSYVKGEVSINDNFEITIKFSVDTRSIKSVVPYEQNITIYSLQGTKQFELYKNQAMLNSFDTYDKISEDNINSDHYSQICNDLYNLRWTFINNYAPKRFPLQALQQRLNSAKNKLSKNGTEMFNTVNTLISNALKLLDAMSILSDEVGQKIPWQSFKTNKTTNTTRLEPLKDEEKTAARLVAIDIKFKGLVQKWDDTWNSLNTANSIAIFNDLNSADLNPDERLKG